MCKHDYLLCDCFLDEETRRYWTATAAGLPTFRVSELLDSWYIKSWFSQRKSGKHIEGEDSGLMYRGKEVMRMRVAPLREVLHDLGIETTDADGKNLPRSKVREQIYNYVWCAWFGCLVVWLV